MKLPGSCRAPPAMVGVLDGCSSGSAVGSEEARIAAIMSGLSGSGAEGALRAAHASTLMWNWGGMPGIAAECARAMPAIMEAHSSHICLSNTPSQTVGY